jgi:hypothetical protein
MPQTRLQAGCGKQALTHHPDDGGNNRLVGKACGVHGTMLTKPCRLYKNADVKSPDNASPVLHQA